MKLYLERRGDVKCQRILLREIRNISFLYFRAFVYLGRVQARNSIFHAVLLPAFTFTTLILLPQLWQNDERSR
jgi:hypothetical protein